jgi:hypothetical protein
MLKNRRTRHPLRQLKPDRNERDATVSRVPDILHETLVKSPGQRIELFYWLSRNDPYELLPFLSWQTAQAQLEIAKRRTG